MAKYVTTIATSDDRSALKKILTDAGKTLTRNGRGSSHYVVMEKKRGTWQVNMYER